MDTHQTTAGLTRRSVVKAGAWSAPVVTTAAAAPPAAAASPSTGSLWFDPGSSFVAYAPSLPPDGFGVRRPGWMYYLAGARIMRTGGPRIEPGTLTMRVTWELTTPTSSTNILYVLPGSPYHLDNVPGPGDAATYVLPQEVAAGGAGAVVDLTPGVSTPSGLPTSTQGTWFGMSTFDPSVQGRLLLWLEAPGYVGGGFTVDLPPAGAQQPVSINRGSTAAALVVSGSDAFVRLTFTNWAVTTPVGGVQADQLKMAIRFFTSQTASASPIALQTARPSAWSGNAAVGPGTVGAPPAVDNVWSNRDARPASANIAIFPNGPYYQVAPPFTTAEGKGAFEVLVTAPNSTPTLWRSDQFG